MPANSRSRVHTLAAWGVLLLLVAALAPAAVVRAHTDFESSDPTDGAVVADPVERVTITFTTAAEPAGDGFVALDASGLLREPSEIIELDERSFELRFDPALAGGQVGISWEVRAGDAHPINGTFSFTVTAATTPTTAAPTTAAPTTDASAADTSAPDAVTEQEAESTVPTSTSMAGGATDDDGSTAPISLEEFLANGADNRSDTLGRFGRTLTLLAVTIGLGVLAFTATALRGSRNEVAASIVAVQVAGAAVAVGAVIEFAGLTVSTGEPASDVVTSSAGVATMLRFVGGALLSVGLLTARSGIARASRPSLSAAVIDDRRVAGESADAATSWRWHADRRAGLALAGAVALVVSFWFDGHTVTEGWRPLHALVDSVHVIAGSVWVGGVVAMAALLWTRRRSGRKSGAAELVVRFSPIATLALIAVAAAGALMTFLIVDTPGDLFSTEWGQVLLLKSAAVAVVAALGGYNHFVLRPKLDAAPGDEVLADRVRTSVTAEAILLAFVVIVTASLVAASTI